MASITHRLSVLSDGSLGRQFYQVKHDYELHPGGDFPLRPAEVFPLDPKISVKLNESLQRFWYSLLQTEMAGVATEEQMKFAWAYLTHSNRAFTNFQGSDIRHDYINETNVDQPDIGLASLLCGGAIVAGVEDGPDLIVETIDPSKPLPAGISYATHRWLIFYATVGTKAKLSDGTYAVTRFTTPAMRGCDAPVPIIAARPLRFPLVSLKKLRVGAPLPSPYNPAS